MGKSSNKCTKRGKKGCRKWQKSDLIWHLIRWRWFELYDSSSNLFFRWTVSGPIQQDPFCSRRTTLAAPRTLVTTASAPSFVRHGWNPRRSLWCRPGIIRLSYYCIIIWLCYHIVTLLSYHLCEKIKFNQSSNGGPWWPPAHRREKIKKIESTFTGGIFFKINEISQNFERGPSENKSIPIKIQRGGSCQNCCIPPSILVEIFLHFGVQI